MEKQLVFLIHIEKQNETDMHYNLNDLTFYVALATVGCKLIK